MSTLDVQEPLFIVCKWCGRRLESEYYFKCKVCGAIYCYIHRDKHKLTTACPGE